MQKAQEFICIGQVCNPCIPGRVGESVAQASEHEGNDQNGVWWVDCIHDIGQKMAGGAQGRNTALAEVHVNSIIEKSR